jgi:FkbM family methyltransferase
MLLSRALQRWRENYYVSTVLALMARPAHALASSLSREIERKVRQNGATIPLPNGQQLRLARDSGVTLASNLYWRGLSGYEPETSRVLRFLFAKVRTFVDVGANYGFYSLLSTLLNPELRVVAFEPVPAIFAALQRNVALNQVEERVFCCPLALSDSNGAATFHLPTSHVTDLEATGTLAQDSWQTRKQSPQLQIEAVRFDDFERSHPMKLELVKIDVEDFEAAVLAGMSTTIQRDRPFVVCEILPREHQNEKTRRIVEDLGYTAYWIVPEGLIRVSRFDFPRPVYENFLLSPVTVPGEIVGLEELWRARADRRDT